MKLESVKSESVRHSHFEHERVWHLLPYYANDHLEQAERQAVAQHLGECLVCRRELERVQVLREAVLTDAQDHACASAFARLNQQIAAQDTPRSWVMRVVDFLRGIFEPVPLAAGASLLIVSSVLTATIVMYGQAQRESVNNQPFQTLGVQSAERSQLGWPSLRIVLRDELAAGSLAAWLEQHHAELIDGPSEIGVMTVRVSLGQRSMEGLLRDIRSDADTLFVEPIDQVGVRPDRMR